MNTTTHTTRKTCSRCQVALLLRHFAVNAQTSDGYSNICRPCKRDYDRQRAAVRAPSHTLQAARRILTASDEPATIHGYHIVEIETGRVVYVGQSKSVDSRWRQHVGCNGAYSADTHELRVVVTCDSKREALLWEALETARLSPQPGGLDNVHRNVTLLSAGGASQ